MQQTYRSGAITGLAAQLKRSPVRLRLRQLRGVEFVLSILEARRKYPLEFVTHAITGYRAKAEVDAADSLLLGSDTLLEDLILLAEELSADADLAADRWVEPVSTVTDLAGRFKVSTKTIFRWHRRGLIGWRFRFEDGRQRLAFPERCVRRFVAENTDLVNRGASFSQLTDVERQLILDQARTLVEAGERTVNAVAKILSEQTNRAVETIRLILKSYDDAHPRAGIFNRSKLQVAADDHRLAIWEAHVDGAGVAALASRFQRPPAEVYRIITEMRARDLRSRPIEFMPSPEFELADADARILDAPELAEIAARRAENVRVPSDLPPYLQELFRLPLLTREQEFAIFRKMNYLRFKADRTRAAIDPETATAVELDRIDALVSEAGGVKNEIVQSNLRLVVSISKRHNNRQTDFFETVSDGNISLMRAVDKFDFTRGFKFSTYASWAIIKNFARSVPDERIRRDRYQTGREELLEACPGFNPEDEREDLPLVRSALDKMLETLDEREREILRQRYGLDNHGEPLTLEQIGQRYGVSKERVRQLEVRAIQRLRSEFSDEVTSLLGS